MDGVGWDALPFSAIASIVEHAASTLPRHQAAATLSALRSLNCHWRASVDDAMTCWQAPVGARAPELPAALARWAHLRQLKLQQSVLDAAAVDALARCRRLTELRLCGVEAPAGLFEAVARLPVLRRLSYQPAGGAPVAGSLAPLAACTELLSLELHDMHEQVQCSHAICGAPAQCKRCLASDVFM